MEAGLQGTLDFTKIQNHILKFYFLRDIYICDPDVFYKNARFQFEILGILDYTKITKPDKFYSFEMCTI
jgi:hypothetical protein